MITQPEELAIAIVVLAILIFIPPLRRIFTLLIRLAVFLLAVAIIGAGVTMILNDETIFEKPGVGMRVTRFVTMNSAAASSTGSSAVTCDPTRPQPELTPGETAAPKPAKEDQSGEPQMTRNKIPTGVPAPLDDVFPELIRRGYPGIPRPELFKLSQDTVNSLGGWRIVKADPSTYTIDCIYTPRYFKLEDDVRITVDQSGDIEVCSRSGLARPDNTSLLRYFPGDLGSNVGHIKDFYEALEPKMDEVYQQEQEKQNAKKPQH
jgi:hypothetical protein